MQLIVLAIKNDVQKHAVSLLNTPMEGLILLAILVILILLIVFNSNTSGKIDALQTEVRNLQLQLKKSIEKLQDSGIHTTTEKRVETPIEKPVAPVANPERWIPKEPTLVEPTAPVIKSPQAEDEVITPPVPPAVEEDFLTLAAMSASLESQPVAPKVPPPPRMPPPPPKPGFFERNPDLEKFIGENLVSKIGIAILVIAIGIFVKFAIDNEWIGPVGRVSIGLLCGGILTFIAHRLQKNYKAFSSVLIGGGIAIFYFSIALAYKDYHLFSQPVAFGIMTIITAFAVVLSLLYDRQEVAVLALIGGFTVPFIVNNGSGNYPALFTYLLLLNTALLIIAYRKAWRLLNLLAFLFTIILFGGWMTIIPGNAPGTTYRNGMLFATAFYLLFLAINIAHNVKQQKKFIASDFGIILANTSLYFAAGVIFIYKLHANNFVGLFSGALGAFNLLLCFLLYRNKNMDKNVIYLLIGITLTFISLTIPLQLHGHYITLFWASEAVLLYWLYQRSSIALTRITSMIIWACMLVSLLMDWAAVYDNAMTNLTVIFNKGFITTIYAAVASCLLYFLRKKEMETPDKSQLFLPRQVFLGASIILFYLAGCFELQYQFSNHFRDEHISLLYLLTYTYLFVWIIYLLSQKQQLNAISKTVPVVLQIGVTVLYLVSLPLAFNTLSSFLTGNHYLGHFAIHWLGALVIGIIIYQLIKYVRNNAKPGEEINNLLPWIFSLVIVLFISSELALLMTQLFYNGPASIDNIHRIFGKAGLSIIWSLSSFAFMWLGMKHKYRPLRIISLTLFLITLIKLFVYDIQNIPVAGKIAAFFCLGVLLLVVSFMYARLKKILTDDEKKPE